MHSYICAGDSLISLLTFSIPLQKHIFTLCVSTIPVLQQNSRGCKRLHKWPVNWEYVTALRGESFLSFPSLACFLRRLDRFNFPSLIQLLLISSMGQHPCTQSVLWQGDVQELSYYYRHHQL